MTKEETHNKVLAEVKAEHGIYPGMVQDVWLKAMDLYAQSLLSSKDARIAELEKEVERLKIENNKLWKIINDEIASHD